jgi:hypothetical protein
MPYLRKIDPPALDWRSCAWGNGAFDTARRPYNEAVEGTICTPHHLVLVTIGGGAEYLEVAAACGHNYVGNDRPGTVSFIPAHCERRFKLRGVRSEWVSIALNPGLFESDALGDTGRSLELASFTNIDDPFTASLAAELARLYTADGGLDRNYCDAMSWALAHHFVRRHGRPIDSGQSLCGVSRPRADVPLRQYDVGLLQVSRLSPACPPRSSDALHPFRRVHTPLQESPLAKTSTPEPIATRKAIASRKKAVGSSSHGK